MTQLHHGALPISDMPPAVLSSALEDRTVESFAMVSVNVATVVQSPDVAITRFAGDSDRSVENLFEADAGRI